MSHEETRAWRPGLRCAGCPPHALRHVTSIPIEVPPDLAMMFSHHRRHGRRLQMAHSPGPLAAPQLEAVRRVALAATDPFGVIAVWPGLAFAERILLFGATDPTVMPYADQREAMA